MNGIRTTRNRYLDIVILTHLTENCVNRDDSDRPKMTLYCGDERQAPSSQFMKRGLRESSLYGMMVQRSKYAPIRIAEILGLANNPEARKNIAEILYSGSFEYKDNNPVAKDGKIAEVKGKTKGLIFYGDKEIEACAEILRPHAAVLAGAQKPKNELARITEEVEKGFADALSASPHEAALIALYGRMTTNSKITNAADAALSVCQTLSTSRVEVRSQYQTAVDDARPSESDEGDGAGHINRKYTCHGSNLLAQYRINLDLLAWNAGFTGTLTPEQLEAIKSVVVDFVTTSFDNVMPGAANQGNYSVSPKTHAAVFRVSRGMASNLIPAFQKASPPNASVEEDADRLFKYLELTERAWGPAEKTLRFNMYKGDNLQDFVNLCIETAFGGNE
jgi:hypothetical protein